MLMIALINGNFDTVRHLLAQYFPAIQNARLKLDSMSLIHLSLVSAFTVPQDQIATEELFYLQIITELLQANLQQDINYKNRLG